MIMLAAAAVAVAGCKAKRTYPEPAYGWHSPSFSAVFGRVRRIAGANADAPAIWVVRFGTPNDVYFGELALTPAEKMTGYTGGESVEIHGHLLTEATTDAYNGRWYSVDSVQLWSGYP